MMTALGKLLAGLVLLAVLASCDHRAPEDTLLLDFESDAELDSLSWTCRTLYSLSREHATHGSQALKMELCPSEAPGLTPHLAITDWSRFAELSFDIYNPSQRQYRMGLRIDDRRDYPDFGDRYNKGFEIRPGSNHITVPLYSLVASGANRHLQLGHIARMFLFLPFPRERATLYVDAVKLTRSAEQGRILTPDHQTAEKGGGE